MYNQVVTSSVPKLMKNLFERETEPQCSNIRNHQYSPFSKLTRANANQITCIQITQVVVHWRILEKKNELFQCQVTFTALNKQQNMGMFLKWISQHQCQSQRGWLSFLSLGFEIPRLPATTAFNPLWNHSFKCYQDRLNSSSF